MPSLSSSCLIYTDREHIEVSAEDHHGSQRIGRTKLIFFAAFYRYRGTVSFLVV